VDGPTWVICKIVTQYYPEKISHELFQIALTNQLKLEDLYVKPDHRVEVSARRSLASWERLHRRR